MPPDISIIRSRGAARILTESANLAHAHGLTVSLERDLGVVCTSIVEPHWEPDPTAKGRVSALGSVLLALQPPIVDVDHALAYVFGTRPEFADGVEDGVAGQRDVSRDDQIYRDGAFLGVQLRELIQHRRRGVPVERIQEPTTQPMVVETPRALIAELLDTLTVPDLIEAAANNLRSRMDRLGPGDQADDLSLYEQTLRELADEARGSGV